MLIDPQYVPAMLLDDKADLSERMVSLISEKAEQAQVNVFHRWALMRHWHVHNNISFERMLDPTDPDKLHQSDASTLRLSRGLCDTIMKARRGGAGSRVRLRPGESLKFVASSVSRLQNHSRLQASFQSRQGTSLWDIYPIMVYRLFSLRSSGGIWSSRCKTATAR